MHAIRTIYSAKTATPAATDRASPWLSEPDARKQPPRKASAILAQFAERARAFWRATMLPMSASLRAKGSAIIHLPAESPQRASLPIMRKRFAVLAAVVAVPALASGADFGQLPGDAPTEAEIVTKRLSKQLADNPAMDFERPGMSFPGSAFYFLADPSKDALIALPTTDPLASGEAEAGRELGQMIDVGPAARPFYSAGGIGALRAQECLAQAVWYEAASESEAGQRAVAQVVLNRVAHPGWPSSVCGVVYQGSERRTGCQFTFTCDGSLARRAGGASWTRAQRVAADALSGSVYEPIGHATHYHTLWVNPYWASSLDHVGTIGAHRFYRNRGAAGEKGAFTNRYSGFEPTVNGRTTPASGRSIAQTIDVAPLDIPDTATSSSATVAPRTPAARSALPRATPEADLADPSFTAVGQVREAFANAGRWKSKTAQYALQTDERALAEEAAQSAPKRTPQGQ